MKQDKIRRLRKKYEIFIWNNYVKVDKVVPEVYNDILDILDYVTEPKGKSCVTELEEKQEVENGDREPEPNTISI